jgi:glycine cleavage system H protein
MEFPDHLKYTKEHEWARVENGSVVVGVTDYAQDSLGEVVYVELPDDGSEVTKDEAFGVIESTKAVSDLYSPVSGTVTDVNDTLLDSPELINEDPYDEGWILKIEMSDPTELESFWTRRPMRRTSKRRRSRNSSVPATSQKASCNIWWLDLTTVLRFPVPTGGSMNRERVYVHPPHRRRHPGDAAADRTGNG